MAKTIARAILDGANAAVMASGAGNAAASGARAAMGYARIQMDFQKAKDQADKLERIARDLNRVADNDMSGCMRDVSANWKGENAKLYVNKGYVVAENIRTIASGLMRAAATVRTIAQETYNAERRALEIAKQREY